MSLDYPELVKQSLKNAWGYKFLWLFGFLVAGSDYSGMFNWVAHIPSRRFNSRRMDFELERLSDLDEIIPFGLGLETIFMLLGTAFLLWLFFFIMSFLSEGALIQGVSQRQLGRQVSFGECWAKGIDRFWHVLAVLILIGLMTGLSAIFIIMILIPVYILSVLLGVILTITVAIPFFFVILFVTESVAAWSIRFTVMDNVPCIESLGKGWRMLRENIGKSFGVGLSSTLVQTVFVILIFTGATILIVPLLFLSHGSPLASIVMVAPLALLAIVTISSFLGVFKSSIWTMAYMQITGKTGIPAASTIDPGSPPPSGSDKRNPT